MSLRIVRASGRASCRNCSQTIKADELCLVYPSTQWNSNAYVHCKCVINASGLDEDITFVKLVLQEKAREEK